MESSWGGPKKGKETYSTETEERSGRGLSGGRPEGGSGFTQEERSARILHAVTTNVETTTQLREEGIRQRQAREKRKKPKIIKRKESIANLVLRMDVKIDEAMEVMDLTLVGRARGKNTQQILFRNRLPIIGRRLRIQSFKSQRWQRIGSW